MCLILAVCRFSGLDVPMPGCQSPWWYQSGVLAYPNKYLSIEISQSTLPTYLEHSSLLLLDCARLVIGSLGLYNLTTAIRMCHSPSSSMHFIIIIIEAQLTIISQSISPHRQQRHFRSHLRSYWHLERSHQRSPRRRTHRLWWCLSLPQSGQARK